MYVPGESRVEQASLDFDDQEPETLIDLEQT
jgi:hypothetical protein